jgi:hypothetical protein
VTQLPLPLVRRKIIQERLGGQYLFPYTSGENNTRRHGKQPETIRTIYRTDYTVINNSLTLQDELIRGFSIEADGFCAIAANPMFKELIGRFSDYTEYLVERNKTCDSNELVARLSGRTMIVDAISDEPAVMDILYTAHIAVCCELFRGWLLPLNRANRNSMRDFVAQKLEPYCLEGAQSIDRMMNRLHTGDAVRTMQILRLLGLITEAPGYYTQLSFAAGAGTRDIRGLHVIPEITTSGTDGEYPDSNEAVLFDASHSRVKGIILIDNDPSAGPRYDALNTNRRDWVIAMNKNADLAMRELPELLKERNMSSPNLVVGLRIDHRMIPDIREFMEHIANLITQSADLVITIGAGDTVDEFKGRVETIKGIFSLLEEKGMKPVRVVLHGGGTYEEQRNSICFGLASLATYEILYCRLDREKLLT